MTDETVTKLGLILAAQAEVEAMMAKNKQREIEGKSMAYTEENFVEMSEKIRSLSLCPEHLIYSYSS